MLVTSQGKTLQVGWRHNAPASNNQPQTTCYIKDDDEVVATGIATLSVKDNFCRNTGRKISLARAMERYPTSVRKVFWDAYFAMRNGKY